MYTLNAWIDQILQIDNLLAGLCGVVFRGSLHCSRCHTRLPLSLRM